MSKLDKLNITGIRSFNTQRGETIQFYTPLTLIVGTNGSGKTTIIESLKYVTTGELPPGAKKGGAFIHDPKLIGEREVMAQAKLQFRSIDSARMVITRSLQLTVTKTSRQQKSLEGSLLMEKNGEKSVISSRVAELDKALPSLLGVSTAVLENVIFCHQEESLWPMSEPLALKKKFDEIFEAEKYIKAIDNIKQIRKKHNDDLGKYKILAETAKKDRDRADKARQKTEQLSDEIEELRSQCQDLDKKMEQARENADRAWKRSESYAKVLGALEGKRIESTTRNNIIEDIKVHLKEVSESDEWLENTLKQFDVTMERYQLEIEGKREKWLEWKDSIEEQRDKLAEKQTAEGKYEQDKEDYERQLERRKNTIKTAATKHHMRGYDDLSDDRLVEEFLSKIKKSCADQNSALDRARANADSDKQDALIKVNRLTERKSALQDGKDTARKQIEVYDREANEFQRKVNQIQLDEGSKAAIESRIEDIDATLRKERLKAENAKWETRLAEARRQVALQDDERARLNSELVQSTKRAGDVAKLAHLRQELKERQRSLQTLMNAHAGRIKSLIGDDWNGSSIEHTYQTALETAVREVSTAERDRDAVGRDLEQVQYKQKTIKDDIASKTKQAEKHSKAVQKAIGAEITEYDSVLQETQTQVEFARDESKGLGGLSDYFSKVLETANKNHACRLCSRPFRNQDDPALTTFKKKLEQLIKKTAADSEVADLADAEARHKRVFDAGIPYATWKKLTSEEIPSLEKELESLSQQRESLLKKAEKCDKVVDQRQSGRNEIEALARTVTSISRCDADIINYNGQIEELSTRQSQQGNIKTLEEIQDDINKATENIRGINKSISQMTSEQESSKNQVHESEIRLRELKNELSTAVSQLDKKAVLAARVDEFKALNSKQREAIDKVEKDMEKLEPEISTAKARYEDVAQRWQAQLADLSRNSAELSDTVNNLNLLNDQIASYIDRGGPDRLHSTRKEIQSLKEALDKANDAQVQLTREISKVGDQLRDSEATKRQYSDNLRYRHESRALEQLRDEISELASQNAEVDRDRFEEESKRHTDQYHKHSAAREGYLGEMKTKDNQLKELINDYETDFKDAPKRYKEAHIRVETTKAAVEDLARYGKALDTAIMKYHSLKMAQINEFIGDLWQNTYQGTDVDSVMIRSDPETDSKANSTQRRQYNYRVTMKKQGVEMDMRGRCSAGQKVLACIIIRLALAECFSVNCGMIALDEPTTNLDRDNIQALAVSLHNIIKTRRQQSNFQLIVITHDEDFLRHMDCGDFTDYYYRVSRDSAGDSIIERQDIVEVDR